MKCYKVATITDHSCVSCFVPPKFACSYYPGQTVYRIKDSLGIFTSMTKQLPMIANEDHLKAPWGGVNNGKRLMKKIGRNRNGIYFNMSLQIILETN